VNTRMKSISYSPRFAYLVASEAELERIATGFRFVEGPVWHPERDTLYFSDIVGDTLYQWRAGEGTGVYRQPSHMANGNTLDLEGRLVTCEHATSRLTRTEHDGSVTVLASHYEGRELNSPNDVVVRRDGSIYFTDPTSGRSPIYGVPREPDLPFRGVYRVDPESGSLTLLVADFSKPNGLCFSPDGRRLFVDDSDRDHIRVFDVDDDGTLAGGAVWAELPHEGLGVADGMKADQEGHIYCCGRGGIHLFSPDGERLGMIQMPEHTTNLAWGDEDLRTLYITAHTSVYRLRVGVPGIPVLV
jgi:gluconolactonase